MIDRRNDATWMYQVTCSHGALLYVGIAYDVPRRLSQHRATKSWWPDVDAVMAIHFQTRQHAARIESNIIGGAVPVHNIVGARRRPSPDLGSRTWTLYDARGGVLESSMDA